MEELVKLISWIEIFCLSFRVLLNWILLLLDIIIIEYYWTVLWNCYIYWCTGLVSSSIILTSWREGASLALVGSFYIDQPYTPCFQIGLVISKSESLDQLRLTLEDERLMLKLIFFYFSWIWPVTLRIKNRDFMVTLESSHWEAISS